MAEESQTVPALCTQTQRENKQPSWWSFADAALRLTWPVILIQGVIVLALVIPGQGKEVARSATDDWFGIKFLICALCFAFILWMLTRTVIGYNISRNQLLDTNKRFVFSAGLSVGFLIILAIPMSIRYHSYMLYLLPFGVIAYVFLSLLRLEWSRAHLIWIIPAAFLLFIYTVIFPVTISGIVGSYTGAYAVLFLGLIPILLLFLLLVHISYRRKAPILFGIIVLLPFGLVWLFLPDYHQIRLCNSCADEKGTHLLPMRVDDAISRWRKQSSGRRMIVVAAAGGGVRAAYWTASILGHIQDQNQGFRSEVFAISAVSGGALGAAAFDASLAAFDSALIENREPKCRVSAKYQDCLQDFLSYDFLSPILASQLTGDLVRQINPFKGFGFPDDRGTALELTWENAWSFTFSSNQFKIGFEKLWSDNFYRPALLLNGTSVTSGKRLVTSNLNITDLKGVKIRNPAILPISLSTAVNNSTRFPFIEPAGGISFSDQETDYVVDGGYYDNYGAATLLDLLHQVPKDEPLIIIQITSDPEVTNRLDESTEASMRIKYSACKSGDVAAAPGKDAPDAPQTAPTGDFNAMYEAAMSARSWTGLLYASSLRDMGVRGADPQAGPLPPVLWYHVGMPNADLPLGWSLSNNNRDCIAQLLKDPSVTTELGKLLAVLKSGL
jgi:hypothetical protein